MPKISWPGVRERLALVCSRHIDVDCAGVVLFNWEQNQANAIVSFGVIIEEPTKSAGAEEFCQWLQEHRSPSDWFGPCPVALPVLPVSDPYLIPLTLRSQVVGCLWYSADSLDGASYHALRELAALLERYISIISPENWNVYVSASLTGEAKKQIFDVEVEKFIQDTLAFLLDSRRLAPDPKAKELRQRAQLLLYRI